MCTWNEIKEMQYEDIFDIQSHGHSHKIPEFIGKDDYKMVENDLKLCKDIILKNLNKESCHLAWPKGVYNKKSN
ncbi:MAG: polysaccharide deacetylase family protein [Thermodesulfovibrio sp.]